MSKITGSTKPIILIAGPSGTGKSKVALHLAQKLRCMIINADSMQVYKDLKIITARPSANDQKKTPHKLYGFVPASESYSVGLWLQDVIEAIREAREQSLLPLIVGGTGLYFKALTEGISSVPNTPIDLRNQVEDYYTKVGKEIFYKDLCKKDPFVKEKIKPSDTQRIKRAFEVFLLTGKSIFDWQKNTRPPFDLNLFYNFLLMPERKIIYDNCELRFDEMIKNGALEEIKRLMSLEIPKTSPLKKALGTQQLVNYLAGKISLEEASIQAKKETRHYVKRQITWFNNQKISWNIINEKDLERIYSKIFSKISINTKSYLTHQN